MEVMSSLYKRVFENFGEFVRNIYKDMYDRMVTIARNRKLENQDESGMVIGWRIEPTSIRSPEHIHDPWKVCIYAPNLKGQNQP